MRRVLIALAILAVTALPSLATGDSATMPQQAGMKAALMRNPEHQLMMAYHQNVVTLGETLARVARQGDPVPGDFVRNVVAEMRRSVEEMEKYRAAAMATLPAEMRDPELQKMMDRHLVEAKTELRQLEDLAKSDRIPSGEVLKHLQFVSHGCQACGSRSGEGSYCGGRHGGKPGCKEKMMTMMPERHRMMVEMTQQMKAQDAELLKAVQGMNAAPRERKVDLLAGIVTQLVQQRADMTANMERMQQMMHRYGAQAGGDFAAPPMPPPPGTPMYREGEGPDEVEDADVDDDDVEMGEDVYEIDDVTE